MTERRSFLAYGIGMLASVVSAFGQSKAIVENKQAVVCPGDTAKCPVCKSDTCATINAPIVVGNDSREYPDMAQLFDHKIICCDVCGAAFFRK